MSFLYDRDYNVTGTVQSTFDFKPSYGTTVSFSAENTSYSSIDNYLYVMPKGVNHLQMTVQMPFENRKEAEATKIASFFENLRGTGYFTFTDPASIYRPINLFCTDIQTDFTVNDIYNIQVNLATDQVASLLNWNGAFITGSNIKGAWSTSTSYSKYDVVKYTGNSTFPSNTGNLYDCFYYCTEPHVSQSSVSPASVDTVKWSKQFFFQPTYPAQVNKETSSLKTELPYSFAKRSDFGLHANTIKSLKLDFKGISDAEARCILHFLVNKQGYRRFQYKIPNIYNKFKVFFAPQWSHTFVYKNVNDISVTLVEDPLGKTGGEIDNIVKDGLVFYLDAANSASYRSGSSSWYDISANVKTASLVNAPVFSLERKGALSFVPTSNQYADFSVSGLTTTATIEVWTKIRALEGMIMGWLYYDIYTIPSVGLGFNTGNGDLYGVPLAQVNSLSCVGNWKHYVFEMRTDVSYTNNKIYINGSLQALSSLQSTESSSNKSFNNGNGRISGWRVDTIYPINMNLAVFRIYNRALTQAEINQNFNSGRERFKI